MKTQRSLIAGLPALVLGESAERAFLFLHGKDGSKEEAAAFAQRACPAGFQVVGVDLPGHGERRAAALYPWDVVPELRAVMAWMRDRYTRISIRANSIGAWFAMQALLEEPLEECLFVSPILDMRALIERMMAWAGVREAQLQKAGEIETGFGETLSWRYYDFAKTHPLTAWRAPTHILYADGDTLTDRETVTQFLAAHPRCDLRVMENGEHWFHTAAQLAFLADWENGLLQDK